MEDKQRQKRQIQPDPFAPEAFEVKDCALASIATGERAQNLKELRDRLLVTDAASIYYHFWGGLLRPTFEDLRYNNDFAVWVDDELHNQALAERLGVIDPADYPDMEDLRRELVEVIEEELDASDVLPWTPRESQFHFIRSQIVVFDTGRRVTEPCELADAVAAMSAGSIFYHLVDARRRTPRRIDDFRTWLSDLPGGHPRTCERLAAVDPFFRSLHEVRHELVEVLSDAIGKEDECPNS